MFQPIIAFRNKSEIEMQPKQLSLLFSEVERPFNVPFPSTRYQGSKRGLTDWIWANVGELNFGTVLDVFGGTGAVSHMFKTAGKSVTYNDALRFNWHIGRALIENSGERLSEAEIDELVTFHPETDYPDFVQRTFGNIYFTTEENKWIDRVASNIRRLDNQYKQSLTLFALFQACLIKRPYNLFHRANLYMRTAKVERSFGNKTSWDTPFETHFRNFVREANLAVFDNGCVNSAICVDALDTPTGADLVYFDPPYLNRKGVGVNYRDFYHFLEGLILYDQWGSLIDYKSKHRRLQPQYSRWNNAKTITDVFAEVIERHRDSILVISYRDDGIPSLEQLHDLLRRVKKDIRQVLQAQQYALSNSRSHELLLIAL
jgi:adenine-specific DNA-methyltransferase